MQSTGQKTFLEYLTGYTRPKKYQVLKTMPTKYLARYKKIPVSVQILSTPLLLFLCLWTLGSAGFVIFSNINLEHLAHKEIEDLAQLFQDKLQQEQDLLTLKARWLSQHQPIIEAITDGDRPALTQHLLPTPTEFDLDWITVVAPNDQHLGAVPQHSLDSLPVPLQPLNQALNLTGAHTPDPTVIWQITYGEFISLVGASVIHDSIDSIDSIDPTDDLNPTDAIASTNPTNTNDLKESPNAPDSNELATLVVGKILDNTLLRQLKGDTSIELVAVRGDRILASTLSSIPDLNRPFPPPTDPPTWTEIGPATYVVKTVQLSGLDQADVQIAILKSIQELENAEQRMYWVVGVFGILGGGLVAGVTVLGFRFTQALSRRLRALTQATQQLADGELSVRLPINHQDDVGILAKGFNAMAEELTLRDQELKQKMQQLKNTLEELHSTQSQMVQNEKMAALGQMIAGIAHEINNPVTFISANLPFIGRHAQDLIAIVDAYQAHWPKDLRSPQSEDEEDDLEFLKDDLMRIIQSIKVGTTRIKEIVSSLRNFSRLDEAEFKQADLHEGIDNTLMILRYRCDASKGMPGIEIVKDYGPLPLVDCYPGHLNQVFMNLLANAIDAVEEALGHKAEKSSQHQPSTLIRGSGPTVGNIAGHKLALEPGKIWISTRVMDNHTAQIAIADNGLGMPKEVQSRIFDPFYTTKPVGKGTGLGLSISYKIITEQHLGKIWCDSTPRQGTKFIIEIPIHIAATPKA